MQEMRDMQSTGMSQDNERHFYTIAEAARLLHVSQSTVWRWIEAQELPAYRVGPRRIRIRKQDLEEVVRPVQGKGVRMLKEKGEPDIFANYNAERVRKALQKSAGALTGVDRQALLADIHAQRRQASSGRPA